MWCMHARAVPCRAADLAPGIAGYRLRSAQLMFQVGEVDKATQVLQGVCRKNPNYAGGAGAGAGGGGAGEGGAEAQCE